jgi:hypothetical protein
MSMQTQPIICLRHQDKDMPVRIETEEEDRFFLTVGAAIQACKKQEQFLEFSRQSRKLLAKLQHWIEKHASDINEAFMTVRDSAFLFLVVQNKEAFNQTLEDSLTDLDLSIAQDEELRLIRLNVIALPKVSAESVNSFLTPGGESF